MNKQQIKSIEQYEAKVKGIFIKNYSEIQKTKKKTNLAKKIAVGAYIIMVVGAGKMIHSAYTQPKNYQGLLTGLATFLVGVVPCMGTLSKRDSLEKKLNKLEGKPQEDVPPSYIIK